MADATSLISMAAALEDPAERDSVHGTSSTRPPTRQQPGTNNGPSDGQQPAGEATNAEDNNPGRIILTPTKLRVDSRVVVVHTSAQWLTNVFFVLFLLWKLRGDVQWTWWMVFAPMWINHLVHIPLQLVVLYYANQMVETQIGPPPQMHATPGMHLQYHLLRRTRLKSHVIDTLGSLIESLAMAIVKMLLCYLCDLNMLDGSVSLKMIFMPFWVTWLATSLLTLLKDRSERMLGSTRDLLYIFLLFVAFKVDDPMAFTWKVVFLIPWMWFSALALLSVMVFTLLVFARVWTRMLELLLPMGFFMLLVSTVPQLFSYILLVKLLDGDEKVSLESILYPNMASWAAMWLSSLVLAAGLRHKELIRRELLRQGHVWTNNEAVARRMYTDREAAQHKIDQLSEAQVEALVEEMMQGKAKPGHLMRVGSTLYRRMAAAAQEGVGGTAREGVDAGADPDGSAVAHVLLGSGEKKSPGSIGMVVLHVQAAEETLPGEAVPEADREGSAGGSSGSAAQQPQRRSRETEDDQELLVMEAAALRRAVAEAGEAGSSKPGAKPGSSSSAAPSSSHIVEVHAAGEGHESFASAAQAHRASLADSETGLVSRAASMHEGDLCTICFERPATCVFLECGHGGVCKRCGYLLFVRPPNECPHCRQRIEQVVQVSLQAKVGEMAQVVR